MSINLKNIQLERILSETFVKIIKYYIVYCNIVFLKKWQISTSYIYTRKISGPVGLSVFSFTTDDYTERETSEGVQQRLHY